MSDQSPDRARAIKGSLWTVGSYGFSQVLRLASNLVLAYLLFPEAFGLMALVNVFLQGLQMFSDVGIGPSIIQNPRGNEPAFLRTAWTIQILRGVILWLGTWVLAGPVAQFYGASDPAALQLAVLLPVAGLTALLGGFTSTGVFILNRDVKLAKVAGMELIPQVISLVVMVVWAWVHPTVWSLIGGGIAFSVVRLGLSHLWNPGERDRPGWDREAVGELVRFGRWVFLSTVVTFFAINFDRILLGKLLSLEELGLYSIGMALAQVPIQVSVRLSALVIFPILSRRQDDPGGLVRACLKARMPVLWLSGAVCVAFALGARWFFEVLYDHRYADAGEICRWLALYCWIQVLVSSMDRIPLALGKPRILLVTNLIVTGLVLLAVGGYRVAALPGFIVGLVLAQSAAHIYLIGTLPAGRSAMAGQSVAFTAGFAAYAAGAIWIIDRWDPSTEPGGSLIAIAGTAGVALGVAGLKTYRSIKAR